MMNSKMTRILNGLFTLALAAMLASCVSDDTDLADVIAQYQVEPVDIELDFSDLAEAGDVVVADENDPAYNDYVENSSWSKVIEIAYDEGGATVTGTVAGVAVETRGAHVTVTNLSGPVKFVVRGKTSDGSLKFYGDKRFQVYLDGADITNPQGAAINNQGSKSFYVVLADGSTNTLRDGSNYAMVADEDQKAALFSEGQMIFSGKGTLNVYAVGRGGIRSDDYIRIRPGVKLYVNSSALDGLRANDGIMVDGGVVNIEATGAGAKGVRSGGVMTVNGGRMISISAGDTRIGLDDEGVVDTTACAALYCDSLITVKAGTLKFKATGDGGKGVNSKGNLLVQGGTLMAVATGTNVIKKAKGVKLDADLQISGGYFYAYSKRSDPLEVAGKTSVAAGYVTCEMLPKVVTIAY